MQAVLAKKIIKILAIQPGGAGRGGDVAAGALDMLKVDQQGLDHMDRRLIITMIEKFDGGPVGVESLSAAIGEERGTIEDVIEPYLIQQGFMMRTPRGRIVTANAYTHFGFDPQQNPQSGDLF